MELNNYLRNNIISVVELSNVTLIGQVDLKKNAI